MKRGALIFEKRIRKTPQGRYFDTVFTDKVLSRYASVVDELVLLVRVDPLDLPEEEIRKRFSEITLPNARVIEIGNVLSPRGLLRMPAMWKKIRDCLARMDVVFLRIPSIWQDRVVRFAKKHGIPCILEVGADVWDTYWHSDWKGKLLAPWLEHSTKRIVRHAAHVVYVTERYLQAKYPTAGETLACSNVDIVAQPDEVLEQRLAKIRAWESPVRLGTLASVSTRSKGQDCVIRALARLKSMGRHGYVYHLAGAGNPDRLLRLAESLGVADQVHCDGVLRHDQIGEWFRSIDIYVQPSRQEGLPRALIEAMSFALPAIGAHTGGIPELLPDSCIFRHGSSPVPGICSILDSFSPDVLCRLSRANFARAADFDARILEPRRHDFFLSAIRRPLTCP